MAEGISRADRRRSYASGPSTDAGIPRMAHAWGIERHDARTEDRTGEDDRLLRPGPADRILIVSDHALSGQALQWALEARGFDILAAVTDGKDALHLCREHRPAMVLIHLGLASMSGQILGSAILRDSPGTKVIAVAGRRRSDSLNAIDRGFHGLLTNNSRLEDIVGSIEAVREGRTIIPTPPSGTPDGSRSPGAEAGLLASRLSGRQREVFALMTQGLTNEDIADRLGISRSTVKAHVQSVMVTLGVRSRLEAVAFARRHRLHEDRRNHARA
jgi:two-component system, NarL family, nitrate/nitrite response regulator NarL